MKVHYTADPEKNPATPEGQEWLKRALAGVKGGFSSSSWRKEMEIDFKARSGQKVFEGLELMRDKIMIKPFQIHEYQVPTSKRPSSILPLWILPLPSSLKLQLNCIFLRENGLSVGLSWEAGFSTIRPM